MGEALSRPCLGHQMYRTLRLSSEQQSYFHNLPADIVGMTLNYLEVPDQARIYLSHSSPINSRLEILWKHYWSTRISYGPTITITDSAKLLFIASEFGHLELVKRLFAYFGSDPTRVYCYPYSYITPFHTAVIYRHRHLVSFFLDRKVDVNLGDLSKLTALHYAVGNGDLKTTNLLLNRNANPHLMPSVHGCDQWSLKRSRFTPVGWAIHRNQSDILRLLHSRKVDLTQDCVDYIDTRTRNASILLPPLHYATVSGNVQMVKVLLDCGLDPNGRSNKFTPLHTMVHYGLNLPRKQISSIIPRYIDIIRMLIQHGADITIWTPQGDRPIDLLTKKKRMDARICELLTPKI